MDAIPSAAAPQVFPTKAPRQRMLWAALAYSSGIVVGVYACAPFWFLLEGDAEKKVERHIALNHPGANLLKVGHHGSAKATTPELVSAVKPAFAVISVGSGNSFGLPRREILGRLADAGTRVYRTDLDGAVTFYLDGHSVTASVGARQ